MYIEKIQIKGRTLDEAILRYKEELESKMIAVDKLSLQLIDENKYVAHDEGVVVSSEKIIEESNYYPFGLKHKGYNNVVSSHGNSIAQKFGYRGIELEEFLGLSFYKIDLIMCNPTLGRFNEIDSVVYFSRGTSVEFDNNPVFWVDYSGENTVYKWGKERYEDGKEITFAEAMASYGLNQDGSKMKKKGEGDCEGCKDQTLEDGFGDVEFQQFSATVQGSKKDFERFKEVFTSSPQEITNNPLATYVPVDLDGSGTLTEGDHIDIDILGPDNGSVRIAKIIIEDNRFELYFQALEGHPDAGNIRFSGTFTNGSITFETYNITRVNLGWYSDFYPFGYKVSPALARAAQKNQWRRVLNNFANFMGKSAKKLKTLEFLNGIIRTKPLVK